MDRSLNSDDKEDDDGRKLLPPRPKPLHKRTWSGGVNLSGLERVLTSFTPPLLMRKRAATIEEEREEFHNRNQQFLQSVQKAPRPDSLLRQSASGSYRGSPQQKATSLESIGDDKWEQDDEGSSEGSDLPPAPNRVESKDMHLLNEAERHQLSESSFDETKDESTAETPDYQRQTRSRFEQKLDLERQEEMARKLSGVIDRNMSKTPREKEQFIREYAKELEQERESLIKQWKAEFEAKMSGAAPSTIRDPQQNANTELFHEKYAEARRQSIFNMLATLEVFICNMPLTIAALALSWATLGVVWFKFGAEHLTMQGKCKPVHFHDPENTYVHEFPGSFSCEQEPIYKGLLYFHFSCTIFAAILASFFLLKVVLAWRVVSEDLANPVTATPVGVICITLEVICAAGGKFGKVGVFVVAIFHGLFAFWYLYVAVFKFKLLPDPSWFPGMVGLAYAAVKTWLICNLVGKIFLAVRSYFFAGGTFDIAQSLTFCILSQLCLSFFFGIFFISIIRVALNKKIAAPVCWIQLSAPSIALYAATIMSQPTYEQEMLIEQSARANHSYHVQMHEYYLPFLHCMFALCLLGMASSVHSLWARWDVFKQKEFSPAHLAFCFPTLSHTNAVQAYRASLNSFSTMPQSSLFHRALYLYWVTCLVVGSIVNIIFTYKALIRLPKWTNINITGEDEPPKPSETMMSEMLNDAHEIFDQPFVSPAVLQANETGTLIRVRRGTEDYRLHGPYVRTRHVTAFGFDPTLSLEELRDERARLMDWVARNAPRTRNRTLSIPVFLKLRGNKGQGIYGTFGDEEPPTTSHRRSQTMGDI
jgi:hypothetical protein